MAKVRDRSENFREAMRRTATSLGYKEHRHLHHLCFCFLDGIQEISRLHLHPNKERVEMCSLSMHVLQQAQQIELLYVQAIEAMKNMDLGNRELSQAIKTNSSNRTFILLFFIVLTFSALFLDWYS